MNKKKINSTTWTILGEKSFIGRHIAYSLMRAGEKVDIPNRNEINSLKKKNTDILIYCLGITTNFSQRPLETYNAHAYLLSKILSCTSCSQIIYLSSSRVYMHNQNTSETAPLCVFSHHSDDIYTLSKLAGENICNALHKKSKIIRLSNVYSTECIKKEKKNFTDSLIHDALYKKEFSFQSSPYSAKDFIHINDVVNIIIDIAIKGQAGIYNVASGINTSNQEIAKILQENHIKVSFESNQEIFFPIIDVHKIDTLFPRKKRSFLQDLESILKKSFILEK